jgi:hypothetical protein
MATTTTPPPMRHRTPGPDRPHPDRLPVRSRRLGQDRGLCRHRRLHHQGACRCPKWRRHRHRRELGLGLLLLVGFKARWAALGLAIFTAVITPIFHNFWAVPEAQQMMQQMNFTRTWPSSAACWPSPHSAPAA